MVVLIVMVKSSQWYYQQIIGSCRDVPCRQHRWPAKAVTIHGQRNTRTFNKHLKTSHPLTGCQGGARCVRRVHSHISLRDALPYFAAHIICQRLIVLIGWASSSIRPRTSSEPPGMHLIFDSYCVWTVFLYNWLHVNCNLDVPSQFEFPSACQRDFHLRFPGCVWQFLPHHPLVFTLSQHVMSNFTSNALLQHLSHITRPKIMITHFCEPVGVALNCSLTCCLCWEIIADGNPLVALEKNAACGKGSHLHVAVQSDGHKWGKWSPSHEPWPMIRPRTQCFKNLFRICTTELQHVELKKRHVIIQTPSFPLQPQESKEILSREQHSMISSMILYQATCQLREDMLQRYILDITSLSLTSSFDDPYAGDRCKKGCRNTKL